MMKFLLHIWFVMMLLTGILVSCNRVPKYDSRLVAIDSIIYNQYELALKQLDSIRPDELTSNADKAFYSLLHTQARYLNYFDFRTDSDDINIALEYYKKHSQEKEKLTRTYLYKGAVLDELYIPDSAMVYYKKAELNAGKDDDFNRGYAQFRMGNLYRTHNAYDGRDIEKYEDAAESFRKSKNNHYLLLTLRDLGALYRWRKVDKAEETLNKAIALAEAEKDTSNFFNCVNLLAYFYSTTQHDNDKAYKQLQRIKSLNPYYFVKDKGYAYATFACVYANKGKLDSARFFLERAEQDNNDPSYYSSYNYLIPKSQICKASGDMFGYYKYSHICDSLDNEIRMNQNVVKIMHSELQCDQDFNKNQEKKNRINFIILASVMLALLMLALLFYRRAHRYDKLVLELKDRSQSQINDLANLQGNINELKINDERLKGFISSHMGMMREMIEACYHEPNNRIAENMKHIIKFQDSNRDNWVRLYDYIDLEHNNIMAHTQRYYPQLNDRELLLLALTCMGFSYIQTAIIMGYSNATSVSVIKQRLAKKMGLEGSLNDYIDSFSNEKTASET